MRIPSLYARHSHSSRLGDLWDTMGASGGRHLTGRRLASLPTNSRTSFFIPQELLACFKTSEIPPVFITFFSAEHGLLVASFQAGEGRRFSLAEGGNLSKHTNQLPGCLGSSEVLCAPLLGPQVFWLVSALVVKLGQTSAHLRLSLEQGNELGMVTSLILELFRSRALSVSGVCPGCRSWGESVHIFLQHYIQFSKGLYNGLVLGEVRRHQVEL